MCEEYFLSFADLQMVLLLRVELAAALRAGRYVSTYRGPAEMHSLNVHSGVWSTVKAALTAGMSPNFIKYSAVKADLINGEPKCHFRMTSTLLFQESSNAQLDPSKCSGDAVSLHFHFDVSVVT